MKECKGVKVSASKNTKGFGGKPKIMNKIWGDHRIGDPIKLGEKKK